MEGKSDKHLSLFDRPALLFLPASNPRAIRKARESQADAVILDLEDAVKPKDKDDARASAVAALAEPWPMPVGVRINTLQPSTGLERHPPFKADEAECAILSECGADFVVIPKVEETGIIEQVREWTGKPIVAMIETPYSVLYLREWVTAPALCGLIAGTNDLASQLGLPGPRPRTSMTMALQTMLCAARAAGLPIWDGVFNDLEGLTGFEAEAREGRALGFDGKSLIHPNQIAPCHAAFAPSAAEIDRARRLVDAYQGGAERFDDAMIEQMHVDTARRLLERAGR